MKRVISMVVVAASLLLAASPVMAADTYHYRNSGTGLSAYFSNVPWGEEEIPAGTYFETYVDASSSIGGTDGAANDVCVSTWRFTIDEDGNWIDEDGFGYCGQASVLALDKKLSSAHVVASFPVEDCLEWDADWEECIGGWEIVGSVDVDLLLAGSGPLQRQHGTSTGGEAGFYQYTYHGSGTSRMATASGSVMFDGASLIDGATMTDGYLWSMKQGEVDVVVCKPTTGC